MLRAYYWGEFGWFNTRILARIERLLVTAPMTQILLATYPDYLAILQLLFPSVFFQDVVHSPPSDYKRQAHGGEDVTLNSAIHLLSVLQTSDDDGGSRMMLRTPIRIGHIASTRSYVSFCCRNRSVGQDRNCSPKKWQNMVNTVRELCDLGIVFHGLPAETCRVVSANSYTCRHIYESITYLNRSVVCITGISGFAQFAANCCCDTIQVGPLWRTDGRQRFFHYAPFKTKDVQVEREQMPRLRKLLTRVLP